MLKSSGKNKKENSLEERVSKLREQISRYQKEYHELDSPSVSDEVYDSLVRELRVLEDKNPELKTGTPLERIGGKPLDSFSKVSHDSRVTSLNDIFSIEEIKDWQDRLRKVINKKIEYFCELKLDGLSAVLIYKNGLFVRGATRGDGLVGEDITENIKMVQSVPLKLSGKYPKYAEIRGEVVMLKRVFEYLNKNQEKNGKPLFANTRNAAAGSIRQLDPHLVKERNLTFYPWEIIESDFEIEKQSDKQKYLKEWGFLTHKYNKLAESIEEVFDFIKELEGERVSLPFGTDGVVISVENIKTQEILGIVGRAPRYKVAYKYQAEQATTKVKDITVNVGRTGVLTPVAHFDPTLVAGSVVSKSTLHNIDQINRLNLKIGDTVVIQKAGDVIPEVVEVLQGMRSGKEKTFEMPITCPVCGFDVERKAGFEESSSVAYYCTNKHCPARSRRGLQHFVNIFEIYEIGPKILDRLKDEGLISDAADLFTLEKADLSGLERFGEKSASNIISSIESHKKVLLWRFIYALGIIHVGEQTARDLADHFGSLDKLMKAGADEINDLENIGPVVSKSIVSFFQDKININFINKLLKNGVVIHHEKVGKGIFSGKTFVLTGTLSTMSREDAKKRITEKGGKVASSVSLNTSFVLAGDKPGSKYTDAQKLNVPILSEQEFLKLTQ